jgi:hypothetical protein
MVDRLISDSLREMENRLEIQEKAIEDGIVALSKRHSEIEASGKRLAILSSQCSEIDSLLSQFRERLLCVEEVLQGRPNTPAES